MNLERECVCADNDIPILFSTVNVRMFVDYIDLKKRHKED